MAIRRQGRRPVNYDGREFVWLADRVVDSEIRIGRWFRPVEWLPMNNDGNMATRGQ